jgi:hypothetical protein
MAKEKLPAIHLYPGDWLRDPISGCSLAAQGLWLRMMFVAHDAPTYGHIFASNLLHEKTIVARRCGCSVEEFDELFLELKNAGVPGFEGDVVISRRMVRDASLRATRAKAGRKGGKQNGKQNRSKTEANSEANTKQNTENESENEDENNTPKLNKNEATGFENFWEVVHQKIGKREAESAYAKAVKRLKVEKPDFDPHAYLAIRMKAFAQTPSANPTDRTPIHPATWLNQGRYDDDPATWQRGSPRNNSDPRGNLALRDKLLAEMETQ